jgi:NADH-quinone oxidoreductase subunit H
MKQLLALELPFLVVIATAIYKASTGPLGAGSLRIGALIQSQATHGWFLWSLSGVIGFIVTMLCVQAKMGLVPFDAPEAEQEIMGGVLTEYSGVALALFKMSKAILLTALPVFVATVFLGGIHLHGFSIIAGLLKY